MENIFILFYQANDVLGKYYRETKREDKKVSQKEMFFGLEGRCKGARFIPYGIVG